MEIVVNLAKKLWALEPGSLYYFNRDSWLLGFFPSFCVYTEFIHILTVLLKTNSINIINTELRQQ